MKKIQSYLLILIAMFAMAACSDQTSNGSADSDADRLMMPQFRNRYTVNAGSNDPYICGVVGLNSIQLYWSRVDGDCIGYEIRMSAPNKKLNSAEDWENPDNSTLIKVEGADTDQLLLKDLNYSTVYYFAIRAISSRGEEHNSKWYGYGDTGHWADYMGINTLDRYKVPNVLYQKGGTTKHTFDVYLDRSYRGFNFTDDASASDDPYKNNYNADLLTEFNEHFTTTTDANGKKIWRVTHLIVSAASSNPDANVPEQFKMYEIPESAWDEDGKAKITIEGLDENAVYNCEALDNNLLADRALIDAKYGGVQVRMKGDPGAPIVVASNPQDTIQYLDGGEYKSLTLPIPATSLQETLADFMTNLKYAENQSFYLEGGKAYFLRGGLGVYKGLHLATNPEDLAAGKGRAKVYLYYPFDFTAAGGNSPAMFMLGRNPEGSENPLIALDMEKVIFENIDFGEPKVRNAGDGNPTNSYVMNTYGTGMGVKMTELRFSNCTFQDFAGGFFRVQGSYGYEIDNFTVEGCEFYNGGYYSTSGRRYNYFHTHPDKSVRQNIYKHFVMHDCTIFDNSLGRIFSHNNNPKEDWPSDCTYDITFENNTLVNFGRDKSCLMFYMNQVPGGSTFTVRNNLFVNTKQANDVARPQMFAGCDIRLMRGGSDTKLNLNIGNNWTTDDKGTGEDDQLWNPANTAFSGTKNTFGMFQDEEVNWGSYGRAGLVVRTAAGLKATDLMVQPNPPFIQTAGSPNHNDHRCDGIDGTATATHNIGVGMVDLHFKNFDNDIYRNNVGASKWRQR